jgi:hypothetical protein
MRGLRFAYAAVIATVVLTLSAQPIVAQREGPGPTAEQFNRLDTAIEASVAERHQHSFLVQSEHARDAALGTLRLPPSPCVALNRLNALDNHVAAQTGKKVAADGARVIRSTIGEIRDAIVLPPNPC